MSSNNENGIILSSSTQYNNDYTIYKAFDNNSGSSYASGNGSKGYWINVYNANKMCCNVIRINWYNANLNAKVIRIYGYDEDVNDKDLNCYYFQNWYIGYFANVKSYYNYRIEIDANGGNYFQTYTIQLYQKNSVCTGFSKFIFVNDTQSADNNLIESQRTVNIISNGSTTINPVSGKNGLASVVINTNVAPSYPEIITEQIKTVNIDANGQMIVLPSQGYDAMEQVNINVNIENNLQNSKSVLLEQNGIFTITPDSGYDGIESVTIDNRVVNSSIDASIQDEKIVNIDNNSELVISPDSGYNLLRRVKVNTNVQPNLIDINENISVPGSYEFNTPENYDGIRKVNINVSNIIYYDITKFYYIMVKDQSYNNSYNQDNSYYLGNFPPVDDTMVTNIEFSEPTNSLYKPSNSVLIMLKNENNMLRFFTCFNTNNNTSATGGAYYNLITGIASNNWYYIYYKLEDNNYMPLYYVRSVREGSNLTMIGNNIPNAQLLIPSNDENDSEMES